jgi:PAP2 superfamily
MKLKMESLARSTSLAILVALTAFAHSARADVVIDWNVKTDEIITEARIGTPPAIRAVAMTQTAAYYAVNLIMRRYAIPSELLAQADAKQTSNASVDAAVAAAHRNVLLKALPAQQASIDKAYEAALASVPSGNAKSAGIAVGEAASAFVLGQRVGDGPGAPEAYRPHASAGTYVPTAPVAVPQWSQRKPWVLANTAQVRPSAPPALGSETWAREYNEVKSMGAKNNSRRTEDQTAIARFWEYSLPQIYHGVVQSVAKQSGRDTARNARLFAASAQAMDDAMMAVFDAKYHYNFWRPVTAIRNGDVDGNNATERDASWSSLIDAPMHPEFPSGHSILAAAVASVLRADVGSASMPELATTNPVLKSTRRWSSTESFVQEVSDARIYGGIHYRAATEAGAKMGKRIGELAAAKFFARDQSH